MEIGEILIDAFKYPIENIKAMGIYLILVIATAMVMMIPGIVMGLGSKQDSFPLSIIACIFGFIILMILLLLLEGYLLDVVKTGINRGNKLPGIDFKRQFLNGIKLLALAVIYMGAPIIILACLATINKILIWIGILIIILALLAFLMAQCRLAKTDSITEALIFEETVNDIFKIGFFKLIVLLIAFAVIGYAIYLIGNLLQQNSQIIGILFTSILSIYLGLAQARGYGLLYSNI